MFENAGPDRAGQQTDPLTGLGNYDAFACHLAQAIEKNAEGGVSLALYDVDCFGRINSDHGRETGDNVLKVVAEHLVSVLGWRGALFRYGGDAIAVVFEGVEKEQAFLLAEQARKMFDHEHVLRSGEEEVRLALTISAGLSASPDDGTDDTSIVRKANEALYRAKVSGPNKVCLAREEKMVTKTSHYTQGQLQGLARLAKRMGQGEAVLLREGLDDLLRKYNA